MFIFLTIQILFILISIKTNKMLIIHPDLTSKYAKCNDCKTIHIITRINTESRDNCKECECKCSHFTIISAPITKDKNMPFVDISRFLIE
jgi:hypothetical protein